MSYRAWKDYEKRIIYPPGSQYSERNHRPEDRKVRKQSDPFGNFLSAVILLTLVAALTWLACHQAWR